MDGEFLPVPNPTHAKFCTMPESAHPGWRITDARDRNSLLSRIKPCGTYPTLLRLCVCWRKRFDTRI